MDAVLQGGGMVLSGVAVAKIADAVSKMWAARHQRTEIAPQPLEVKGAPSYVTCEECALKHKAVDERLSAGTRAFDAVEGKMDANQRDVMNSIQKLNDRISPMAESCAENGAAIRILLGENLKTRPKP